MQEKQKRGLYRCNHGSKDNVWWKVKKQRGSGKSFFFRIENEEKPKGGFNERRKIYERQRASIGKKKSFERKGTV